MSGEGSHFNNPRLTASEAHSHLSKPGPTKHLRTGFSIAASRARARMPLNLAEALFVGPGLAAPTKEGPDFLRGFLRGALRHPGVSLRVKLVASFTPSVPLHGTSASSKFTALRVRRPIFPRLRRTLGFSQLASRTQLRPVPTNNEISLPSLGQV